MIIRNGDSKETKLEVNIHVQILWSNYNFLNWLWYIYCMLCDTDYAQMHVIQEFETKFEIVQYRAFVEVESRFQQMI